MRLDERFLDELKGRLRLSDVIGRTVKLRRQGREYVGLSPFAKEKTPSFFVNDDKGFFHDFSSGKHGDLIGFLQETERLSFREAVERLAGEAGMALPAEDPRAAEAEARRFGLIEWLEEAAKWFEAQLRRPQGEAARAYLDRRALPKEEWGRFRLGFAPAGRTGLKDHLIAKGAQPGDLVEAGLLIAPDDGAAPYDRFRDRIIFPIADHRGRVVSFGGRALDPEARAKYLNGPESPVFHKGRVLYGLFEARKLLHAEQTAKPEVAPGLVVVEGYMDVIACQRAGVAGVASMGTALTEEQMEALWKLHEEPTLCFDGDAAGKRAAARAMDRALPLLQPGRSFRFAFPEGGKDPDDVLREHGAGVLKSQLAKTQPFVQALFEREREALDIRRTPEAKAGLKVRLRKLAASIANRDLSEAYRESLFESFYRETKSKRFQGDVANRRFTEEYDIGTAQSTKELLSQRLRTFNAAVAWGAILHAEWAHHHIEQIAIVGFGDRKINRIIQPLLDALTDNTIDRDDIVKHIRASGESHALGEIIRFACEVPRFNFIELAASELTRRAWEACFKMMIEIAQIESELAQREREKVEKRAFGEGEAAAHVERGYALRTRQIELMAAIHAGPPWFMEVAVNDNEALTIEREDRLRVAS